MTSPLISVITPTLNCGQYLRDCIERVRAQNYPHFEHIVIDGGSADNTVSILQEYPHLKWISEKDNGEAQALNKALAMVSGEIIYWLNADDYCLNGVFKQVAELMQDAAKYPIVYGDVNYINEADEVVVVQKSSPKADLALVVRWWKNFLHPHQPAIFYSREVVKQIGGFTENLFFAIDHEFLLRAVSKFPLFYINKTIAVARLRDNSKSCQAGADALGVHKSVSVPYVQKLSVMQQFSFWSDYFLQHKLPISAQLKIQLKLRTRLKQAMALISRGTTR